MGKRGVCLGKSSDEGERETEGNYKKRRLRGIKLRFVCFYDEWRVCVRDERTTGKVSRGSRDRDGVA